MVILTAAVISPSLPLPPHRACRNRLGQLDAASPHAGASTSASELSRRAARIKLAARPALAGGVRPPARNGDRTRKNKAPARASRPRLNARSFKGEVLRIRL